MNENVKALAKFMEKNPHVSIHAMWRLCDVIYNLPEEVGFRTKVMATETGSLKVILDVKGKPVGLCSSDGLIFVVDFIENWKSEPRVCFTDRVPVEVVCEEVLKYPCFFNLS